MAEMGINPYTISLVLNHVSASKSTVTSKVYIQYSFDREKREVLNAWGARLEEIVDGKLSGQANDMLGFNVVRTGRQFGHGADLIS